MVMQNAGPDRYGILWADTESDIRKQENSDIRHISSLYIYNNNSNNIVLAGCGD